MVKAVIFDRDGVLVDSEFTNVRSAELAFAHFGVELTDADREWIVGRHPDDYLVPFLERHDIDVAEYKRLQRLYYYEVLETTPVFTATIDLLKELHAKGLPLALCTSASREGTLKVLDKLGVRDYFQQIITNNDYTKKKPDPEPYLVAAEKLGVRPEDCLVIEDSSVGLRSALAAGMKCIVIYNDYTKKHDFSGALRVVGSASELDMDQLLG